MFKILQSGVLTDRTTYDDDYDMTEPKTACFILETEEPTLSESDQDVVRDYFRLPNCGCPGDCCGHRHGGVSKILKMWDHQYVVITHTSRNY
jgi:hypothetical protein